jgi:hypothetical protein
MLSRQKLTALPPTAPLQCETLQPSGSGPWPFVLLIHLSREDFWNKNAPDRYGKALGNLPDS